jgi:hypothetical protein
MMWLAGLVLVALSLPLTLSSPINAVSMRANETVISRRGLETQWKLADLNNEFKGILWDAAFSGEKGECTSEQLDTLVYATRASMWMLETATADTTFYYSDAWDRYFKPYQSWLDSGYEYLNASARIIRKFIRSPLLTIC